MDWRLAPRTYLFPALERVGLDTMSITRESRGVARSWTTQQTACSRTSGELLRMDAVDCVSKVRDSLQYLGSVDCSSRGDTVRHGVSEAGLAPRIRTRLTVVGDPR